MFEMIEEINGSDFILLFGLLGIFIIIIARIYLFILSKVNEDTPEPTKISPLDTAVLLNGFKGAILVSLMSLWKKKLIFLKRFKRSMYVYKNKNERINKLNDLEMEIYTQSGVEKEYNFYFSYQFTKKCDYILTKSFNNLSDFKLILNNEQSKKYKLVSKILIIAILLFGFIKLSLGISNDKPVAILIIELILFFIAFLIFIKPFNKIYLTSIGKEFIKKAKDRFAFMKKADESEIMDGSNLEYSVSIFGLGALMNTTNPELLGLLSSTNRLSDNSVYFSDYSTINSSSSTESGCSDSSCSGSSCSGSGCGGCGGGD